MRAINGHPADFLSVITLLFQSKSGLFILGIVGGTLLKFLELVAHQ